MVKEADVVITMGCGDACPIYPGKRYEDWELEDPSGKDLETVRGIRDQIAARIDALGCRDRSAGAGSQLRRRRPSAIAPPIRKPTAAAPTRISVRCSLTWRRTLVSSPQRFGAHRPSGRAAAVDDDVAADLVAERLPGGGIVHRPSL